MRLAEPVLATWKAHLGLRFEERGGRSVLAERRLDGPLVVQKALYPEGDAVCHAIVVHPPGGIAGGDELVLACAAGHGTHALLTTPGAGKWYRSGGAVATQRLQFAADGILEWLPRETIVFDGAIARLESRVDLGASGAYIGWEVACLGRGGTGERFASGELRMASRITRAGRLLWAERGHLEGDGEILRSRVGLGGRRVFGTMVATLDRDPGGVVAACRAFASITHLPGLLLARYLGDSTEEAFDRFTRVWERVRPVVAGREAARPRIWST